MIRFEINGIAYTSSKELEKEFGLCKTKTWKLLKASQLEAVIIANTFFYPAAEAVEYIQSKQRTA